MWGPRGRNSVQDLERHRGCKRADEGMRSAMASTICAAAREIVVVDDRKQRMLSCFIEQTWTYSLAC